MIRRTWLVELAAGFVVALVAACSAKAPDAGPPTPTADAGADTATGACAPGEFRCVGDILQTCNPARTDYAVVATCKPGKCDVAERRCNNCAAGTTTCATDRAKRACSADGQTETDQACATQTPFCVDQGKCVQCRLAPDCPPPASACVSAVCTSNVCGVASVAAGTSCDTAKFCNGKGTCADCQTGATRCNPAAPADVQTCSALGQWQTTKTCTGACNAGACVAATCGDGNVDAGEQCDDTNTTKCDGCESCELRRWITLPAGASASVAGITAALPRGDLCVEAWAKVGNIASGDGVLVSSYGAPNNGAFLLRCQNGNILVFAHEAGGPVVSATTTGTTCGDGKWHHFAGCRSVVGGTVTNTVFLDGVLKATASGAATTIGANAAVYFGGVTYGQDGLDGAIDEVRISSVVRYTADFVPARRHVADASTVGLWHLDEGAGTTLSDASGNGYDGTLGATGGWAIDSGYNLAVCQ